MVNIIVIQGRLADNAQVTTLPTGAQVTRFTIANNEYIRANEKRTTWIDVSAWNGTASKILQYLTKGKEVTVVGSLRQRDWVDKHGQKRRSYEVFATDIRLGGGGGQRDGQQAPAAEEVPSQATGYSWDDVPF